MSERASTTILILYTELAGYTIAALNALHATGNVRIHLVRWPVNKEAPFEFNFGDELKVYDRSSLNENSLAALAAEIKPDLILCSGWNDKGYLAVCKAWSRRIPVVLAMDNKWTGGAKQQLARIVSRFTIQKYFNACFVPGEAQKEYARKLGFAEAKIKTGFYTCDTERFSAIYSAQHTEKKKSFPHVFIYAGRYYEFKGVTEMWSAFARFKSEMKSDWKLVCLGTGDVPPASHPDIGHKGFVQPDDLAAVMQQAGVFILPSRFEPWAVVVQEFATAGFPLLLSEAVGAKEAFLQAGENGYSFAPDNEGSIVAALKKTAALSDEELWLMGKLSHQFGMQNTPERWARTLLSFLQ